MKYILIQVCLVLDTDKKIGCFHQCPQPKKTNKQKKLNKTKYFLYGKLTSLNVGQNV